MEYKHNKKRQTFPGGHYVNTTTMKDIGQHDNLDVADNYFQSIYAGDSDITFENFEIAPNPETSGATELLRIESLRCAIGIARLMSDITVDDILTIAESVYDYLK